MSKASGITLVQLHFDATHELCEALDIPYIKVIRAQSADDIKTDMNEYRLIDAYQGIANYAIILSQDPNIAAIHNMTQAGKGGVPP